MKVGLEIESLKNSDILLLVVGAGLLGPLTEVQLGSGHEVILEPSCFMSQETEN